MTPRAYEWRIANISGVDVSVHRASICSMISQVLRRGQHDEAKHRAGPVLDDLRQLALPRWGEVRAMGIEKMWTVDELAEFAGVSVTTLYHWRWEGKGPKAIKVGRYLRYPEGICATRRATSRRGSSGFEGRSPDVAGRHPLALGTWGQIRTYPKAFNPKGRCTSWRATTLYRDIDATRGRSIEEASRQGTPRIGSRQRCWRSRARLVRGS
jgi:hypothetical protein